MIKYAAHNIEEIKPMYRVISVHKDEDGKDVVTYSEWVERDKVKEEIKKAEQAGQNIVMVQGTHDVTSDFYRI